MGTPTPPNILPLLETILAQQAVIYSRLATLREMLSQPTKPIEPTLEALLRPLAQSINDSLELTQKID